MSSTVIRVPRITGFPIIVAGLISIRSVVIAIPFTRHSAPPESHNRHSPLHLNRRENVPSVPRSQPSVADRSRLAIPRASRYYLEMLRFDWDERKNRGNRSKHGIWFEEARTVFNDPQARLFP
jgi:hypothetical protein